MCFFCLHVSWSSRCKLGLIDPSSDIPAGPDPHSAPQRSRRPHQELQVPNMVMSLSNLKECFKFKGNPLLCSDEKWSYCYIHQWSHIFKCRLIFWPKPFVLIRSYWQQIISLPFWWNYDSWFCLFIFITMFFMCNFYNVIFYCEFILWKLACANCGPVLFLGNNW